jgi:DNA-binding NarL/FixJ family response regulator
MQDLEWPNGLSADGHPAGQRIVIISRSLLWRDCFAGRLERTGCLVQHFANLTGWLEDRSECLRPTVLVLCEPHLRDLSKASRALREIPTLVILSEENIHEFAVYLSEGARGAISTGFEFQVVLNAIMLIAAGGTFVPKELLFRNDRRTDFGGMLTQRQLDVVEAVRQGKANKQIAHDLNLCESTVKVHIRQIMKRLDVRNRTEIAVLAKELLEIDREAETNAKN